MSISRELNSPKFNHEKLTPGGLFLTYQTLFLLHKNQFFKIFLYKKTYFFIYIKPIKTYKNL